MFRDHSFTVIDHKAEKWADELLKGLCGAGIWKKLTLISQVG